jgi:hypothetical protein
MRATIAVLLGTIIALDAAAQAPADSGRKSPALAGFMSAILPGVGSWYAGNGHHAAVHGAIALGLGGVGAVTDAGTGCNDFTCAKRSDAKNTVVTIVFLGLVTNQVWSIVTAVRDADTHNDELATHPTVHVDPTPALALEIPRGGGMAPRLDLRLLRLTF